MKMEELRPVAAPERIASKKHGLDPQQPLQTAIVSKIPDLCLLKQKPLSRTSTLRDDISLQTLQVKASTTFYLQKLNGWVNMELHGHGHGKETKEDVISIQDVIIFVGIGYMMIKKMNMVNHGLIQSVLVTITRL